MSQTRTAAAPAIHPANACALQVRHTTAVRMAAALCDKGTTAESDLLQYIQAALPALPIKRAPGIAKEMARPYAK